MTNTERFLAILKVIRTLQISAFDTIHPSNSSILDGRLANELRKLDAYSVHKRPFRPMRLIRAAHLLCSTSNICERECSHLINASGNDCPLWRPVKMHSAKSATVHFGTTSESNLYSVQYTGWCPVPSKYTGNTRQVKINAWKSFVFDILEVWLKFKNVFF